MFWKSFSRKWKFGLLILLCVGIGASALAFASGDPENPRPWPERILRSLREGADHSFIELSSALFDNLDDLDADLFHFPGKGRAGIDVHRDVLDNFDLMNTYTVIDRVRLKAKAKPFASFSTWTEDVATRGIGTPFASLVFDPRASVEWTDVRSVRALDFKRSPKASEVAARALSPKKPEAEGIPAPAPSPDPDLSVLKADLPLTFLDPSIRARFSHVLNLVTFPFRLPLHRADVSRMQDGEILSYAFDGQVEVGISVGLKVIPTLNVLHAGIDIRGTVLLHGRHEISVLRENARYARVKLTRLNEKGFNKNIKIGIDRKRAFDGVMLFGQDHVLSADANFVPFDFKTSRIRSNQFDVVYRYDLDDPDGEKAYHQAVLGNFALSEKTSGGVTGDPSKPVEKLLSRKGRRTSLNRGVKVDLASVLRLDWNGKREALDATLELPDGSHHVLEAIREKKKANKVFFGATNEKATRRITLYLDAELLAKDDPGSVFVITEVTEEDSNTKGKELNRSIERMEKFLRKPDILPVVPDHLPGRKNPSNVRNAYYGRSSFYYGYSLSLEEVGAFLRTDRATIAESAAKYFNEDEARRFLSAWEVAAAALERNAPAKELFQALQGVFTKKFSVEPLTNVIFDAIPARLIDYFVTAQNVAFGRIQERGKVVPSVEEALTNTDRALGFRDYAQRLKQDSEAVLRDLHVDTLPKGLKKIRFTLDQTPVDVFFRLFRVTGFKRQKVVTEIAVTNRSGRFHRGENTLLLDPSSPDLLTAKLSRDLRRGEFYNLSIAYSRKADRFGPVSSSRFKVEEPYSPPN
jgi:hypothetical protein